MASSNQGKPVGASRRGFASMDPERQRQIASEGGKAAHEKGTAHEFTSQEARAAGSKGGKAAHEKGTAHEFTSQEAREAGRKGGQSSGAGQPSGNTQAGASAGADPATVQNGEPAAKPPKGNGKGRGG